MFSKLSKNSPVKRILVFSLSNIGDVVLACPVLDVLLRDFPQAELTLMLGAKTESLFAGNGRIKTIIYHKRLPLKEQLGQLLMLRRQQFDVIVDLRQTALGLFLGCPWQTPIIPRAFGGHLRAKHLERLKDIYPEFLEPKECTAIIPRFVSGLEHLSTYVAIVPGAADSAKRWTPSGFAELADILAKRGKNIVFTGGVEETQLIANIQSQMSSPSTSMVGKADLCQLAFILKNAELAITHDSGAMHIASYFGVPVVALYGPTDPYFSGPWSKGSGYVHRNQDCPRCQNPKAVKVLHECMSAITVGDVIDAIDKM